MLHFSTSFVTIVVLNVELLRVMWKVRIRIKDWKFIDLGNGYYPQYSFNSDRSAETLTSSWNIVKINDEYKIIDTQWGSRIVSSREDMDYNYEEFYFCPSPHDFISTHFPFEESDQLLETPISFADFSSSIKVWPLFHKMQMTIVSHTEGFIRSDEGKVVIVIETPAHSRSVIQMVLLISQ